MTDGPFTDDLVKHALLTTQTQRGIIEYAEGMAQVLAEAGRASHKATGDAPSYAVNRWAEIIRKRALEILREDAGSLREGQAAQVAQVDRRLPVQPGADGTRPVDP